MNKDINKFKNSKGKITNKLANDIYETQMNKDMTTKEKMEKYDMLGIGASLVHIYFKDLGIIRYTREESYSVVDLIGIYQISCYGLYNRGRDLCGYILIRYRYLFSAAFGGIVGLCMGFSLLSGFELIYFFTIRVLFNKILNKKHAM